MAEFNYKDSSYKFTAPVRKFKANDPYYYEVDNIPLGQLEQNDLWLRDQIVGVTQAGTTAGEIGRSGFSELKPFAPGSGNTVRIKPGRYTARINDAYKKQDQQLGYPHLNVGDGQMGAGGYFWGGHLEDGQQNSQWWSPYQIDTNSQAWKGPGGQQFYFRDLLYGNFQKLKSGSANNALFMNGLGDRILSHAVGNVALGGGGIWIDYSKIGETQLTLNQSLIPEYLSAATLNSSVTYGYPLVDMGIGSSSAYTDLFLKLSSRFTTDSFSDLAYVAAEFTKRWAGAVRTSVVDVPALAGEDYALEITIPPFKQSDFYYIDEAGGAPITVAEDATRIDLVFIYSKPVDASSTTVINNGGADKATQIFRPELGVVVGAGLAVDYTKDGTSNIVGPTPTQQGELGVSSFDKITTAYRSLASEGGIGGAGNAYMLPSVADSIAGGGGFTIDGSLITGSFPSPDDLMNLTPDLINDIQDDDARLIGQSILPIAYIRRNQNTDIVTNADIIDIRPFFRTTELSYNERAGIAAATPSLSFANPAVGKTELLRHFKHLTQAMNLGESSQEFGGPSNNATLTNMARPIGAGIIWGGKKYGPEAALNAGAAGWEGSNIVDLVDVPDYPDWDIANWCTERFALDDYTPGSLRNDRMFLKYTHNKPVYKNNETGNVLDFSDDKKMYKYIWDQGQESPDSPAPANATDNTVQGSNYIYTLMGHAGGTGTNEANNAAFGGTPGADSFHYQAGNPYQMYYIKKKINFAGGLPAGFTNYDVKCSFLNCIPLGTYGTLKGEEHDGHPNNHIRTTAQPAGFWFEKSSTHCIIYLAFIGPSCWYHAQYNANPNAQGWRMISDNQVGRQTAQTRTFAVVNSAAGVVSPTANAKSQMDHSSMMAGVPPGQTPYAKNYIGTLPSQGFADDFMWDKVGVCTYPTVQFEIIGYPGTWGGFKGFGLGTPTSFDGSQYLGGASMSLV